MAALDILSATEASRAALGTDATAHEEQIQRMISAISARIDEICGPVVEREVTEYHAGGREVIRPRQTPVSSVTTLRHWNGSSITVYTQDEWGEPPSADGFLLEQSGSYAHDARIVRQSSGTHVCWLDGHRSIELVYVAGRAADTDSVSPKFKLCAETILRRAWDREAGAWARGADPFQETAGGSSRFFKAIDPMVREFLADEMKPAAIA